MSQSNLLHALRPLAPKWSKYIPTHDPDTGKPFKPTPKQLGFLMLPHIEALYGGMAGVGKICAEDGVVLTPFGFKKCVDLELGDRVNNPDGTTAKIIQLHPWGIFEKWRVHFNDGTFTDVTGDHLWLSWRAGKMSKRPNGKRAGGERSAEVVETRQLKKWLDEADDREARGIRGCYPCIPVCAPQVFNVTRRFHIELDPYLLGSWLGDGHHCQGAIGITSADVKHTKTVLGDADYKFDGKCHFILRGKTRTHWISQLKRAKLLGTKAATKFVPKEFLMGSIEERYSILQGLLDTDGTVDTRGEISFCSVSRQLVKDVAFLVRSLGGTAVTTKKSKPFYRDKKGKKVFCQSAYNVFIKHPNGENLFRMKRKKDRCKKVPIMYKRVVKIEVGGKLRGRCLTVSHPNGLYLTNDFIVTHNSIALLAGALQYADVPGYNAIIFRKSLTDANLGGAVLDRAMKWLDRPDVHFDQRYSKFRFPEGSSLTIGYLKNEGDHERYKSAEFQYIGFDEQTDFAENVFLFLISRLRRVTGMMQVPLRIRGATNPGGLGHVWVKQRYKIEKHLESGKWVGQHPHRPFIAAYRADNPHIDLMSYEYNLSQLGTMDRLRMKEGDWSASESARFKEENFVNRWVRRGSYIHCPNLKKSWHFNTLEIFFTLDPAASSREGVNNLIFRANREPSYSVVSVWARTYDNHLLWLDQIRCQVEIPDILQIVLKAAKIYRPGKVIIEANGVGKGVHQVLEFMGLPIHPVTTSVDKLANASCALTRASAGKILLPEDAPWIPTVFGEILVWTGHPAETADQVDALANACIYVQDCAGFSEREYDTQPPSTPEIVGESWSNGISVPSDAWTNYAVPQLSYAG